MELARVLVVQPNVHYARVITAALQAAGWTAFHTESGRAALRVCAAQPIDAVLVELDLEDIDGLELVAAIRSLARPPRVFLCSRVPQVATWDEATRASLAVESVLLLPARPEEIVRALEPTRALRPTSEPPPREADTDFLV